PYALRTHDGRLLLGELGRFRVPERRADPGSRELELAFFRLPSVSERPGPPIVILAGGPGASAIDGLCRTSNGPLVDALLRAGDVIALDQRATGLSSPRLDSPRRWQLPLDEPGDRTATVAAGRELA